MTEGGDEKNTKKKTPTRRKDLTRLEIEISQVKRALDI